MDGRKLNTRDASPAVAGMRLAFDDHIDECPDCQPALCFVAQSLWRNVCLGALRVHSAEDGA